MNEPLFYNMFAYDKQMARELANHFLFKMKIMRIIYVIFAICIPINILSLLDNNEFDSMQQYTLALILIVLLMLPIMYAVIYFSCLPSSLPDQRISTTIVGEEFIEWKWNKYSARYEIKKLLICFETRNYIVIIPSLTSKTGIIIKKDSFTLGTSDEFIAFLKSKGVKIQK